MILETIHVDPACSTLNSASLNSAQDRVHFLALDAIHFFCDAADGTRYTVPSSLSPILTGFDAKEAFINNPQDPSGTVTYVALRSTGASIRCRCSPIRE